MTQAEEKQNPTRALALSGGGYRATLFALGSLWRLNELGMLGTFNRITAVSGGSILLGYLALHWDELTFDNKGVATNFKSLIAGPIQKFCSEGLDIKAGLKGLFSLRKTIGDEVAEAYNEKLFFNKSLKAIPHGESVPEFIFYATNYDTGSSVRITRDEVYDYKIGEAASHGISIATAVGASSAFPPVFSPVVIDSSGWQWKKTKYADLYDESEFHKRLVLCDGGLYDNLGLEAIWKKRKRSSDHFEQVFVCDAGAPLKMGFDMGKGLLAWFLKKSGLKRNWISQLSRMSDIMIEQQRALRKRELKENYEEGAYGGTYWGITTRIANYEVPSHIAEDNKLTGELAFIPTRLNAFKREDQGHLINWGYALVDSAVRSHVTPVAEAARTLPVPADPLTL